MSITRPNQERSALTSGVRCVELRRVAVGVMGLAIVLLVISLSGCSAGPPAHGTSFLVALDTNSLAGTVNHEELLGHTREVLRQRLEDQGFRFGHRAGRRTSLRSTYYGSHLGRSSCNRGQLLASRSARVGQHSSAAAGGAPPGG